MKCAIACLALTLAMAGCTTHSAATASSADSGSAVAPAREYVQTTLGKTLFIHDAKSVKARNRVEPRYPEEALKHGEQGPVILRTLIDSSGNVVDVTVNFIVD